MSQFPTSKIDDSSQSRSSTYSETTANSSSSSRSLHHEAQESAFPDEDEDTVTIQDLIDREEKLEEEASAVLGNSDEKNCTYPKGYIPRQALYSCATCSDGTETQAAICLACSLECHDNHEVYELYTKRNYRCDCGNSKFKSDFTCKLMEKHQQKSPLNENNKYNHNFSGRYCVCDKRYPPDENDNSPEANDEMWQCIICEDWYHTKHLGAKMLPKRFDELICSQCVDKLEFVRYYQHSDPTNDELEPDATLSDSCKESLEDTGSTKPAPLEKVPSDVKRASSDLGESLSASVAPISAVKTEGGISEGDTNDSQVENKDPVSGPKNSASRGECVLERLKTDYLIKHSQESSSSTTSCAEPVKGPLFWSNCEWRSQLCQCQKCLDMYKEKCCEFLIDEKDTVQYYEAQGKALAKNIESPLERGMSALNRMNRVAVVEALHGYNEMKADLTDYLRKFADSKKVVREEDIHEFFQQLKSKKKPKLEF